LAEPGAVAWQFERRGIILVGSDVPEDDVMEAALEAGAEDVSGGDGDLWTITCEPGDLNAVREALDSAGMPVESSDLSMVATSTVELTSAEDAKPVLRLYEALDDLDDVQHVHMNADIPDEVIAEIED
jgi:transcriptional/translational regulatory protein YebC/TACO1